MIKHRNSLSIVEMEFVWVNRTYNSFSNRGALVLMFGLCYTIVYIASFLASLNSRNHLRALGGGETGYGVRDSTNSRKQSSVNAQAIRLNSVRKFAAPQSHASSKLDVEFGTSSIDVLPTLDLPSGV
jgi:hypothetical protein